ncbi:recombinase family protein [Romboutsia weinsteinii]|uniref:Recombinase family protein n=1 Tax=Romboutsia weinsteinii TaxID=2020949 RepID=A0A371JAU6_9FIRM|nr:recombinase family protein [Romboutsia weinsteinii]RDY29778.1 recombinase family protein [Romboutsia weinsteinii]
MKKNVVLLRVSTDMQDFNSQKNGIDKYVKENNITVHKIIEEQGVSGYKTKLEDRLGLQELIQMAVNDELNSIIVFNQDRLGRRLEILSFMTIMNEQNVKVYSVTEGLLNEDNDTSELIQAIKFWTANYESKKTSLRVKNGKRATIERNAYSGGVANFGYKVVDRKLVINEEESEIVKFIYESYIDYGHKRTLELLEEKNILKRGDKWTKTKMFSILKNNIYRGKKQYQGELLDFPELQIISDEMFNKAQERAKSRNTRGTRRYTNRTDILFEGLLFHKCEDGIDRKLNIDYVNTTAGRVHTYRCKYCKETKAQITKNFISTKLEPILIENIKSIMNNISIKELEHKYNEEITISTDKITKSIDILNKTIEKKKKAIDSAMNEIEKIFMGESNLDINIPSNMIKKMETEIEELENQMEVHQNELEYLGDTTSNAMYLLDKYKDFEYIYDNSMNEERKVILQDLVNKIVINQDEINIQLNIY